MTPKQENAIIRRAQRGDKEAFGQLYTRHHARVTSQVYKHLGHLIGGECEDVVQDVFLLLHLKLKQFKFRSAFPTWLFRVTQNVCNATFRTRHAHFRNAVSLDEPMEVGDDDSEMTVFPELICHDDIEGHVLVERMREEANELAPGYRLHYHLKYELNMGHQEIADLLHTSIGTSKSQCARMKENLAVAMGVTA